jgi:16S rRNA processing protein RimM
MENNYRNIGKIVSALGLKGEMVIVHHLGKTISVSKIKVIFLELKKDEMLPYFVEQIRKKGADEFCVKLEGVDNREAALKLIRRDAWLKEEEMDLHTPKNNPITWIGYQIIDQGRFLGPVLEVIEQPHQVICRLEIDSKEVLIPINEQTLKKVDHKNRSLLLTLPDGLLDVYLS